MWNSTGTVSVTNGSPVVTGAGTVFSFPNAQPGQAFVGPNGLPMEIASVDSASQITLARPYGGATAAGQPFTILPTQSFANDLALAFAGFKNTAGAMLDTIGQGMFPDGSVAAPAIRFAADQDTGFRRSNANEIAVVTGGIDRVYFSGAGMEVSGRVIAAAPDVVGAAAPALGTIPASTSTFMTNANRQYGLLIGQFGNTGDTWVQAQRIDGQAVAYNLNLQPSGGNVGIGTTTPQTRLHIVGNGVFSARMRIQNPVAGKFYDLCCGTPGVAEQGFAIYDGSAGLNRLILTEQGNLLVGVDSASTHTIARIGVSEGTQILDIANAGVASAMQVFASNATAASNVGTALRLSASGVTGRSLNAAGTINASGADYAEYVRKSLACSTILKGDVCGIDGNGELTRTWADARRYVVKSTDPNLVGGDTWAAHLGPRPEAPVYDAPAYDGPAEPSEADGWNAHDAYTAAQADYAQAVAAAEAAHAAAVKDHAAALTAWEAELEAARQTVDRIAFSGQVPVNVDADTLAACEAALGDGVAVYLVAVANGDGIGAAAVRETEMTLPLYMRRLGAVWAIRDGRPWIDVQHG